MCKWICNNCYDYFNKINLQFEIKKIGTVEVEPCVYCGNIRKFSLLVVGLPVKKVFDQIVDEIESNVSDKKIIENYIYHQYEINKFHNLLDTFIKRFAQKYGRFLYYQVEDGHELFSSCDWNIACNGKYKSNPHIVVNWYNSENEGSFCFPVSFLFISYLYELWKEKILSDKKQHEEEKNRLEREIKIEQFQKLKKELGITFDELS